MAHRPDTSRDPAAVPPPGFLWLACADDYLLDNGREDAVAAWLAVHPDGEHTRFDTAPPPALLLRELASPSLFNPARLITVRDAGGYLATGAAKDADLTALAAALPRLASPDLALILTAVAAKEPKGPLVDAVRGCGEVRFLPLPPTPKPWEDVRLSKEQRRLLVGLIGRVAPVLLDHPETVEALCQVYGFRPRALADAAASLAQTGCFTVEAVRATLGAGECSLKQLETAVTRRNVTAVATFLATLAGGGQLVTWRGEGIAGSGLGPVLAGALARMLRQGLAARAHAERAGLGSELDRGRVSASDWYVRTFKPRLFARLAEEVATVPASPLSEMTMWQMHFPFRLGAAYSDGELLRALAGLTASGVERAHRPADALAALTPILLELVSPAA